MKHGNNLMEKASNGPERDRMVIEYQFSRLWRRELIECPSMLNKVCSLTQRNARSNSNRRGAQRQCDEKENVMRLVAACLFSGAVLMSATAAGAQEIDWQN